MSVVHLPVYRYEADQHELVVTMNNLVDIVLRLDHKQEELFESSLNIEEHCGPMQPDVAGLCAFWVRIVESSEMIRSCLRVV